MTKVQVKLPATARASVDWGALRAELGITEAFPPAVLSEAIAAARSVPTASLDMTDVGFWTLDPPDSMDLDQAMHLSRRDDGYRVLYAIADVGYFVKPGTALDVVSHTRGETYYCPDVRVPLYPTVLSEDAASLLPEQLRPALVWTLDLAENGELVDQRVDRAVVRSRAKHDYRSVQTLLADASSDEQFSLLRIIGSLRVTLARARGAVDLRTPQQLVDEDSDGNPVLSYRVDVAVEEWNEQISLLTGIAAARMMLAGGDGFLRILPPPDPHSLRSLRQSAIALGVLWPEYVPYAAFVSALDPHVPVQAALLTLAARLLRGAGYLAFFGGDTPEHSSHNAVAAPYAHCTAPLLRLGDRYVGEICLALSADGVVPQWVLDALSKLAAEMAAADRRANALDKATIDLAEAVLLQPYIGKMFDAVVVDVDEKGAVVQLAEPPVRARCTSASAELGSSVAVRLVEADPSKRSVLFASV